MNLSNKPLVNASQIRAARALLNWSQEELAEASGLSVATIRKLEAGNISPRDKTMDSIVSALEQVKVEFLSSGVRLRSNDLVVLEGQDSYLQLLDDIYKTMKNRNDDVLFLYGDCAALTPEELESELRMKRSGIKWRVLIQEGDTNICYPIEDFRWFPKKFFKRNIQLVYGNKVAMGVDMDRSSHQTTKMIVIESAPLAESTRNLFDFIWDSCRKPTFTTAPKVYEF